MAAAVVDSRNHGYRSPGSARGRLARFLLEIAEGKFSRKSMVSDIVFHHAEILLAAPPELDMQPPAAPAATEAASVHLARWAPHPSADTAPGTEPSPRTPALVTMPPRQKLVDEAPSETAATPAADPSSLPVAESFGRRGAAPCGETLQARKLQVSPEVKGVNGDGLKSLTRDMRSLLGVGKFNECGPYQHLLQREEGFAKLAD